MDVKDTSLSVRVPDQSKPGWFNVLLGRITGWLSGRSAIQRSIGMIAGANLLGTAIGIIGSFVQARFISPDELGFVRKYSVVSGYAIFFSLGLFIILQREYPVLMGRGEKEKAHRAVSIVQSWSVLIASVICGGLLILTIYNLVGGHYREAAAWFIQVVTVWYTLFVGFLDSTYRSGQEFERRSKGAFIASIGTAATIPVFWLAAFPAFVLRSIADPIISSVYLFIHRPVKIGWCLPWREFLDLVKRGMRLFVSSYLRYNFCLTAEIWLMYQFAGDAGVGLFVFGTMLVDMSSHITTAINMVYIPQMAQRYGSTEKITSCLKIAVKPTLLNIAISAGLVVCFWFLVPPIIAFAFPKYLAAIPIMRIIILRLFIIALTLPLFMLTILESYVVQFVATVYGLLVFVGTAFGLNRLGFHDTAVPWGTVAGQIAFTAACLLWLAVKAYKSRSNLPSPQGT